MSKKRVHEVAKEMGIDTKKVMAILEQHNIQVKSVLSGIDDVAYETVKKALSPKTTERVSHTQENHVTTQHKQESNKPHKKEVQKNQKHDDKHDGRVVQNTDKVAHQKHTHMDKAEGKVNHSAHSHTKHIHNEKNSNNHNERNERNERNDRRNKKKNNSKGRAQSLLSTSIAKNKNRVKQRNEQNIRHKEEERRKAEAAIATSIELSGSLTVKELAEKMGREVSEIIKKLMLLGVMATINQEIDMETATIVAENFGVEVVEVEPEEDPTDIVDIEDAPETLQPRPPVVTIMGHVDHGKTSLLDVIRQTNVTSTEAGGITQHIGAYQVRYKGNKVTFLDTPGHEAFTAMRLRGAKSTDIAVLVVAADDGVMPQTVEAINHAKSAEVPIIVAINKMDKPGANPDHVKQQLSEHGLLPEEWGGDVIMVPVSAKKREGIDDLLENILLVAEVMELKANPNRHAQGVVIEAQLDKGRGPVCTMLVQKGSLRVGDTILAGTAYGKVRAMTNERGEKVKVARPSMPVEILGLSDVPLAGEVMVSVDDNEARTIAEKRIAKQRAEEAKASHKISLDDIFQQIKEGEMSDLNIIIKADVQGSVEALRQSLESIKNDQVRIVIVHAAVGAINESDIMLASASNAIILGFNVRPDAVVRNAAEKEKVDLRTYRVIYDAINDVESAMVGMLAPEFKEVIVGRADVRQVISTPKAIVAGCFVTEGRITNDSEIRLIRDGIVVHEGKVDSLRRFKDEVKEVKATFECGISIEGYRDIKEGDVIEAFLMEEIKPTL
ncbi:translation initiation factor IF-2 [Veillonella montpellierensis]|uniref:translation initiation factor IF-2 n=1 Tax=Veillonella montpellierensis TaxID=187328 RepID=UPI0023F9AE68|nr:translation initiation factor IF-2 [Veillonella montpellierensis]